MSPPQRDLSQFNNAPALSTLPLTLPYLVFFLELATVWNYLVYFLFTPSSLPPNWAKSLGQSVSILLRSGSPVLELCLAHSRHPTSIFWRERNEMTPLFWSCGPYLQNERAGLNHWFSKWTSSISTYWERVRNADSQAPPHTCCIRDSGVCPHDLWFISPAVPECAPEFGDHCTRWSLRPSYLIILAV